VAVLGNTSTTCTGTGGSLVSACGTTVAVASTTKTTCDPSGGAKGTAGTKGTKGSSAGTPLAVKGASVDRSAGGSGPGVGSGTLARAGATVAGLAALGGALVAAGLAMVHGPRLPNLLRRRA
jgi:hypothetical protein